MRWIHVSHLLIAGTMLGCASGSEGTSSVRAKRPQPIATSPEAEPAIPPTFNGPGPAPGPYARTSDRDAVPASVPGYLGCQLEDLSPEERRARSSEGKAMGVKVVRPLPDSPSMKAGFQPDDIIVEFDGASVTNAKDVIERSKKAGAGATMAVKLIRDGRRKSFRVTLEPNPFVDLTEPDPSPELHRVKIHMDIAYWEGKDAHPDTHRLDLFAPVTKPPAPVMMWIHGGGWSLGDRKDTTALGLRFAERGVVFATIDHRMSRASWANPKLSKTGVTHPEHIRDVARAFAWLARNVGKYGGDSERIFVGGHSSGGHLATLLATNPKYLAEQNLRREKIRGVVPIEGTYDIPHYHRVLTEGLGPDRANDHIHAVFGASKDGWHDASPVRFIDGREAPMLVMTGEEEAFRRYASQFEAALKTKGPQIRFIDAKDRGHATVILMMTRKAPDTVRRAILSFIESR